MLKKTKCTKNAQLNLPYKYYKVILDYLIIEYNILRILDSKFNMVKSQVRKIRIHLSSESRKESSMFVCDFFHV